MSSRSGEFHPQPLTEPYVNLSIHTALLASLLRDELRRVTDLPMGEEVWVLSGLAFKPPGCPRPIGSITAIFLHHPANKSCVQQEKYISLACFPEPTVVVDPATKNGIEHIGYLREFSPCPALDFQRPHSMIEFLDRLGTH